VSDRFPVILADPPWDYKSWSLKGQGRGASRHYDTMSLDDIMALPVERVAAPDAVLFLWVTRTHLAQAFSVMEAWGFAYKSVAFTWIKYDNGRPFYGQGKWTRANPEQCLLATRGKPKRVSAAVEELIFAEIGDHSAKPYEQYRRIQKLVAGPYLELFSQLSVPGWSAWGNRVGARGGFGGDLFDLPGLPAQSVTPKQPELFEGVLA